MVAKRRTYLTQILREMDGGSSVVSTQAQFQALLNNGGPFKNKKYVDVDGEIHLPNAEDFSGSSFENVQTSRAHHRFIDFSNCRFSDSALSAIEWKECEFANSVFHNSHIGSDFEHCDFDGAVFDNINQEPETISFKNCHLDNTQFKGKISNITFHENTIDTMSFACKSIRDVLIDADCVVKNMSIRAVTLLQLVFQRASVTDLDIHAQHSLRCRFVETPVTNIKFHVEDQKGFSMTNSTFENFEISSNSFSEGYIYRNSFATGVFSVKNVLEANIRSNVMDQMDFSGTQFDGCTMLYNIYHNCKFDNCVFQWCTFNDADDVEKDYIFDTCKVDGAKFVNCALNKYNKERLLENGATIEEGVW